MQCLIVVQCDQEVHFSLMQVFTKRVQLSHVVHCEEVFVVIAHAIHSIRRIKEDKSPCFGGRFSKKSL